MTAKYGSVEYESEVAEYRIKLEEQYGTVWNTSEVQRDFEITGFGAPQCGAIHKETGIKGTLTFSHQPRFYFNFRPMNESDFDAWNDHFKLTITTF